MRVLFVMCVLFVGFGHVVWRSRGRLDSGRIRQGHCRQRLARLNRAALVMFMIIVSMVVIARMFMMLVIMTLGIIMMFRIGEMFGVMGVAAFGVQALCVFVALMRLDGRGRIGACVLDDLALDALAVAAAARVAMARAAAAAGAVFALFLGFAMGAFVRLDQRLPVGDRNLIIVRVDFAEGQKAVAVAAVFDEGRLQRRFYARDLGEIDVAAQLFALSGLEIKFFDAIAADHNDPGLFRVGSIDQHFVGHFGTLDGGARVSR
ncbi:MAG TPA: hypothetical protein VIJ35_17255 [Bradyrhizobium sp.]